MINRKSFDYPSNEDEYANQDKFLNDTFNRRSNFRLNYNPYNLQKSEDFTCDRKKLKILRKIALEENNPKITDKSFNNEIPNQKYMGYHDRSFNDNEEKKYNPSINMFKNFFNL